MPLPLLERLAGTADRLAAVIDSTPRDEAVRLSRIDARCHVLMLREAAEVLAETSRLLADRKSVDLLEHQPPAGEGLVTERAQIVAFIRAEADRYRREAAAVRPLIDTATTGAARRLLEFELASAVSKGSMARVLAACIERGDHLFGQPVMMPEEAR